MKRPKEREERKSNAADFTLVIKESQNLAEAAFVIDPLPFFYDKNKIPVLRRRHLAAQT